MKQKILVLAFSPFYLPQEKHAESRSVFGGKHENGIESTCVRHNLSLDKWVINKKTPGLLRKGRCL